MLNTLLYIVWHPSVSALSLGSFQLRWYSLCWLLGLLGAYLIVKWLYKREGISAEKFDPLFLYCFFGVLLGARLGHCLFYEPDYFLSTPLHWVEMIVPIRFLADGSWHFTGYEGLASHGGTLGLIIALLLYVRRYKVPFPTVLDMIAIATPVAATLIRLGNLMNSEIVGKVTDVPWAFIFERVDLSPRHPGQLYEALCYAVLLFLGLWIYRRGKHKIGSLWYFGLCLTYIFTARFFIEFFKDVQEAFERDMLLNMGQLLSLPFIALGLWCLLRRRKA